MRTEGKLWLAGFVIVGAAAIATNVVFAQWFDALLAFVIAAVSIIVVIVVERERAKWCDYCKGERVMLRHGAGPRAELINCPVCRDGQHIAETTIPTARGPG